MAHLPLIKKIIKRNGNMDIHFTKIKNRLDNHIWESNLYVKFLYQTNI